MRSFVALVDFSILYSTGASRLEIEEMYLVTVGVDSRCQEHSVAQATQDLERTDESRRGCGMYFAKENTITWVVH